MQTFNLKRLVLIAVVLTGIAAIIDYSGRHVNTVEVENIFADLQQNIDAVNTITLQQAGKKLELKKDEKSFWILTNKNNYPADMATVNKFIINLSNARVVEAKTDNPFFYNAVDLDEPSEKNKAMLVQLGAIQNKWSYIFGKMVYLPRTYQYFVRRSGDVQSWSVVIDNLIALDTPLWIDRGFFRITYDKIKNVIFYPDTHSVEVAIKEGDKDFKWVRGEIKASNVSANSIAASAVNLLSGEFIKDVAVGELGANPKVLFAVTTVDGLILTVSAAAEPTQWHVAVAAASDATAAVQARAAAMAPVLGPLIFTMDDNIAPFLGLAQPPK